MIIIVPEQIPIRIERQPATITNPPGDRSKPFPVRRNASDQSHRGNGSLTIAVKESPMSPMIRPFEITIPDQIIAGGKIQIPVRAKGQRMHSLVLLVVRQHGQPPKQAFRLDVRALLHRALQHINRRVGGHIKIQTANRNSVNPGIFRKPIQQLPRLIQSTRHRLINKQRFPAAGKKSPRAVHFQGEKRLRCIGINTHHLQGRIRQPVVRKSRRRLRFAVRTPN